MTLSTRACDRLAQYPWPGNVAELKSIISDVLEMIRALKKLTLKDVANMVVPGLGDLVTLWKANLFTKWHGIGKLVGYVIAEIVFAVVTAGQGTAAKFAARVPAALAARLKKISAIARYAKKLGSKVKTLGKAKLSRVLNRGRAGANRVKSKLKGTFGRKRKHPHHKSRKHKKHRRKRRQGVALRRAWRKAYAMTHDKVVPYWRLNQAIRQLGARNRVRLTVRVTGDTWKIVAHRPRQAAALVAQGLGRISHVAQTDAGVSHRARRSGPIGPRGRADDEAEAPEHNLWSNVLADMTDDIVPQVIQELPKAEGYLKLALFKLLGGSGDARAFEPLRERLSDFVDASLAADALGELGMAEAIPALRGLASKTIGPIGDAAGLRGACAQALEDEDVDDLRLQIHIAEALAKLGDHSMGYVVSELSAFAQDADDSFWVAGVVRMEAVRALQVVITRHNLDRLGEAMHEGFNPEVVENAIDACLYLGSPRGIPHLLVALEDEYAPNRGRAADALRLLLGSDLDDNVCGRRALPGHAGFVDECKRRSHRLRMSECIFSNRPLELPDWFPLLNDQHACMTARIALRLITGIDFAPAVVPYWDRDLDGEARANAWWQHNEDRFEPGRLYRYGRLIGEW